ncbi:MAG: sulfurtransferase TusA family protein [Thiotrichaceae bacterium]
MDENNQAQGYTKAKGYTLVDARNLLCPMPVIRVQEAVETLSTGTLIKAICTDPGVLHDIPAWVRVHGHTLISAQEVKDEYIVVVEVNKQVD